VDASKANRASSFEADESIVPRLVSTRAARIGHLR
jgi:hypothetical protein